jgi:hypothetical protein
MKWFLRQDQPALLLLLLLVALTSIATFWQLRQEVDRPALATFSSEPDGARALLLWAEALGHNVETDSVLGFGPPQDAGLAIILEPQLPGISGPEWQALDEWVEHGGILVLAGEGLGTALSIQHYRFDLSYRDNLGAARLASASDFKLTPSDLTNLQARATLQTERTDYAPLLLAGGEPLVVSLAQGRGLVILSTLPYPLSNLGLKDAGNPALSLALLAYAGDSATIWFDEWHHGVRSLAESAPSGLGQWLRRSRPGQAVLYAAAVCFVWLLLTGTRFGRPLVVAANKRRRMPAEHAIALAKLSRRAGHNEAVRDRYRRDLKNHLGRRYGITSVLRDEEFLRHIVAARPDLDEMKLKSLLEALRRDDTGDQEMLKLGQEVSEWTTK